MHSRCAVLVSIDHIFNAVLADRLHSIVPKMLEDQLRVNFVAMHRNEVQRNAKQREDMQRTPM